MKLLQLLILLLIVCGAGYFFFKQQQQKDLLLDQSDPVADSDLMQIDNIESETNIADQSEFGPEQIDQVLGERNPYYTGSFNPEYSEPGILTHASAEDFADQALFEFGVVDELDGESDVSGYPQSTDSSDVSGFPATCTGELNIGNLEVPFKLFVTNLTSSRLVYELRIKQGEDWIYTKRIPPQTNWSEPFIPVGWISEKVTRLRIPRHTFKGVFETKNWSDIGSFELDAETSLLMKGSFSAKVFAIKPATLLNRIKITKQNMGVGKGSCKNELL